MLDSKFARKPFLFKILWSFSEKMTDVPEVHDETRTKIVILAAGTVLWLLLQIVINFITDLAKLTFVAVVLYLLYLAGERKILLSLWFC